LQYSNQREIERGIIQHLLFYNTTLCEPNLTDSFSTRVVPSTRGGGNCLLRQRGKKVETALLSIAPLHACICLPNTIKLIPHGIEALNVRDNCMNCNKTITLRRLRLKTKQFLLSNENTIKRKKYRKVFNVQFPPCTRCLFLWATRHSDIQQRLFCFAMQHFESTYRLNNNTDHPYIFFYLSFFILSFFVTLITTELTWNYYPKHGFSWD